jgi:hypothetical protein
MSVQETSHTTDLGAHKLRDSVRRLISASKRRNTLAPIIFAFGAIAVTPLLSPAVVAEELTPQYCKSKWQPGTPELFECLAQAKKCKLNPDTDPTAMYGEEHATCPKNSDKHNVKPKS